MLSMIIFACTLSLIYGIVCPPNYCSHVTQPELDCKGSVIPHAGFCGCYNICAKVEGEFCSFLNILGLPDTAICDDGLVCALNTVDGVEGHRCVRTDEVQPTSQPGSEIAARQVFRCRTACERKSTHCAISMIVYAGQWFAKCDEEGNFLPEQCDNTGHCFCVNTQTGAELEGTKVVGNASC